MLEILSNSIHLATGIKPTNKTACNAYNLSDLKKNKRRNYRLFLASSKLGNLR